jgi:hypothetical protein
MSDPATDEVDMGLHDGARLFQMAPGIRLAHCAVLHQQ